ncbi:Uncharacterised protein [Mycobacterium xenopi]|uniref:Uncharacterized protein n=1 Tax=Mycobacterium xenopi TaxID=1789 RepID=A0AAD1M125_MYCXE|nr:hypothetical protein I552_6601 [Mycobacterium xenopi 3993]BBU22629.1 hypothetical protein MYXE_24190 [Mycobacterium xenopi]SPX92610.1 Uncharacterised protein [Mycobacterium xenopi]
MQVALPAPLSAFSRRRHVPLQRTRDISPTEADTASEPRLIPRLLTNREGTGEPSRPAACCDQRRHLGIRVSAERCFATVMLDEDLWRSLVAIGADHRVAWVHGCMLERGHRGDHQALVCRAGVQDYWVQWDASRKPHLNAVVDLPAPRREAHPATDAPRLPREEAGPGIADTFRASASGPLDSRESGSRDNALWAIASALQRLADVIAAAFDASEDPGRHGRRRGTNR